MSLGYKTACNVGNISVNKELPSSKCQQHPLPKTLINGTVLIGVQFASATQQAE